MTAPAFQVVKVGARPLLAIPRASSAVRAAAIGCYPAHTWKKRLVRSLLRLAMHTGLDRAVWAESATPLDGVPAAGLGAWIAEVRGKLGTDELQPVLVWPADAARGRVYAYWLDAAGRVAAFSKLALDRKNSDLIHNEQCALETLAALRLRDSRVPRVLAAGRLPEWSYLIVETAPHNARITQWETDAPIAENVREYAGPSRRVPLAEVEAMPWWQRFIESYRHHAALIATVRRAAADGVEVCRVHGDLNQTNILRTDREIWLLDWERSSECGPCLTDTICMEVDRLWPQTKRDAAAGLRAFLAAHWSGQDDVYRARVLLALAYLGAAEFTPATVLVAHWAPHISL